MEPFPTIGYRAIIFYNFRRGLSAKQCEEEMKKVFGKDCPSLRTIERWFLNFKRGLFNLEDDPRSGRPTEVVTEKNIELVREAVTKDRRITYKQLAETLKISERSIGRIISNHLNVRKLCTLWIPHELTDAQREARVIWCKKMLKDFESGKHSAVNSIITGDESWLYFFDVPSKSQNKVWVFENEDQPIQVKKSRSVGRRMIVSFFRKTGLVANVVLDKQKTVTAHWYTEVCLPQLFTALKNLRPRSPMRSWYLHIDNAPAHRAQLTQQTCQESGIRVLDHPPYSPDLAPCDFGFFPFAKSQLKGRKFASEEELIEAWETLCDSIEKEKWEHWFDDWFLRMGKCIECGGKYFEKQ